MSEKPFYNLEVYIDTCFLEEESRPEDEHYAFAYTIIIKNKGNASAQLISRHWFVTDANGDVHEVQGLGVVGEQPRLSPGNQFKYTSGAILATPVGSMQGTYTMLSEDGREFDVNIPPFRLAAPHLIH